MQLQHHRVPRIISLIFLTLIAPYSPAAPVRLLSDNAGICEHLLKSKMVKLSDLISYAVVEPDGDYLYSPRELITDHELKTATILAERLKRTVAVLPRLNKWMSVPAVDGIMFDRSGKPLNNFSLKTFFPSQRPGDLNTKLSNTIRTAANQIERNYNMARWSQIARERFPASVSNDTCFSEARLYAKIFGIVRTEVRPITVVIDYTADPTAIFRLGMKFHYQTGLQQAYLTLNDSAEGLSLLDMMDNLRGHASIKEYIFLGVHHVLTVTPDRYEMTEYCDSLGHQH